MNAAIWIPDGLLRLVQSVAACGWRNFGVVPKCDFSFQMEITCHFGKIWNHSIGLCFSWKTFVCFFNRCNRELISGFLVLLLGTWHRTISLCLFLFSIYVVKLCWTRVTLIAKVQHFFLVANAEDTPAVALKHTMAMVTVADVFFLLVRLKWHHLSNCAYFHQNAPQADSCTKDKNHCVIFFRNSISIVIAEKSNYKHLNPLPLSKSDEIAFFWGAAYFRWFVRGIGVGAHDLSATLTILAGWKRRFSSEFVAKKTTAAGAGQLGSVSVEDTGGTSWPWMKVCWNILKHHCQEFRQAELQVWLERWFFPQNVCGVYGTVAAVWFDLCFWTSQLENFLGFQFFLGFFWASFSNRANWSQV